MTVFFSKFKQFAAVLTVVFLTSMVSSCGLFKKKCNCPKFEASSKNLVSAQKF
jgi:hypothetical protein